MVLWGSGTVDAKVGDVLLEGIFLLNAQKSVANGLGMWTAKIELTTKLALKKLKNCLFLAFSKAENQLDSKSANQPWKCQLQIKSRNGSPKALEAKWSKFGWQNVLEMPVLCFCQTNAQSKANGTMVCDKKNL